MKYLIADLKNGGFAVNDPIEGWIYTTLMSAATVFDTHGEAQVALVTYYYKDMDDLIVRQI